jgi:superfamily II DNA or RNA helicase
VSRVRNALVRIAEPVMMTLRKHQAEAVKLARHIIAGHFTEKNIIASVTPGGGKTAMAGIFANELMKSEDAPINMVVTLVPNQALRRQMAEGFHAPSFGCEINIRELKGNDKPSQGDFAHRGYVATYSSVALHLEAHIAAFRAKYKGQEPRILLILDEAHHLGEEEHKAWREATEALASLAKFVLRMTGTLARHDKLAVAGVTYEGEELLAKVHIRYTRRDALAERAILPVMFRLFDARGTYEYNGIKREGELSEAEGKDRQRLLSTVINDPSARNRMIGDGIADYLDFCEDKENGYQSQAIVVLHSQEAAAQAKEYIEKAFPMLAGKVALAISEEKDSHKMLKAFRQGPSERLGGKRFDYRVLVTVAMAYEGLDAPWATHLICLTNIRSWSWLDQCVNRVTRFNRECGRPWEKQWAYVFMPCDKVAMEFVDSFCEEQEATCRDRGEQEIKDGRSYHRGYRARLVKLEAEITDTKAGTSFAGLYTAEQQRCIDTLISRQPSLYQLVKHAPRELLLVATGLYGRDAPANSDDEGP